MENEENAASLGGPSGGLDFGQSPFGRLLDLPGIDGPEDIFGGLSQGGGGNPFAGGGDPDASGNPFAGGFGGGAGGNPFAAGGGGMPGGGGGGGGMAGGGGAGGNPFGGGSDGGDGGGNPFAGGGNPFGGGMSGGGDGEGGDQGGDERPDRPADDRYQWDFSAFGDDDDRYVWDFSAFDDRDMGGGDQPDMDGNQPDMGGDQPDMGGEPDAGGEPDMGEGGEDAGGVSVQVVGQPAPGEGEVAITGGPDEGDPSDGGDGGDELPSDYDFSGLDPDAFIFAEHGDRVVVEGGNNKFVVEVRGEGDDGEMGGSTVVVEGGNNQFVIIFDYGGESGLEVMDGGGNPFAGGFGAVEGQNNQGVTFGEPDPNADPAAGIFERGSAPPLDDPDYVGGDAYVGDGPMPGLPPIDLL